MGLFRDVPCEPPELYRIHASRFYSSMALSLIKRLEVGSKNGAYFQEGDGTNAIKKRFEKEMGSRQSA